jgi:protein CpxP
MIGYRTFVSSILLVSSLGVMAAPQQDCGPMTTRGDFREYRVERMAQHQKQLHDSLKLTPDQEGAWQKLMDSMHPVAGMESGKAADWAKLTTPERVEKRLEWMQEHQAQMARHLVVLKEFYALLSPEQKTKFDEFHAAPRAARRGKAMPRPAEKATPVQP